MKLSEQIVRLRTRLGLTQGDLADRLEVSRQSISKWETGASVPELDKLLKMAELFGVSLDELVTGTSPAAAVPGAKRVAVRQILSGVLVVLAGLCMAVTVLFGNAFGIHTSAGVLLAAWFALLGGAIWSPENRKLLAGLGVAYGAAALILLVLHLWGAAPIPGEGIFLLMGLTLAGWAVSARKK